MLKFKYFFIGIILLGHSSELIAQATITCMTSLGERITDKKVIISQGQLVLERFTDSKGKIELVTKLFDTIQPIEITPYGFKSKAVLFDQKEIRITFDSNLYILDDIVLYDKTIKVVKFKNYNETVNRTKGFILFSNRHCFQTPNSTYKCNRPG